MITIKGTNDLSALVGQELPPSQWLLIDQDRIDKFAEATGDFQFIHVDPERAAAEGPFGGTIAHGYLTQSLFPVLLWQVLADENVTILNYGIDKLRFTGVVPVGSRVRLVVSVTSVDENPKGGTDVAFHAIMEIENAKRPALVADILFRYYDNAIAKAA